MTTIQEGDLVMALRGQPDEDVGRVRAKAIVMAMGEALLRVKYGKVDEP